MDLTAQIVEAINTWLQTVSGQLLAPALSAVGQLLFTTPAFDQIQEVIDSGKLPSHIEESLEAVRVIGNFATHPTKSQSTGEIVDVEPGEAEWNLEALEALFDFYYVQPAKTTARKAALNKKLADAGKPPVK